MILPVINSFLFLLIKIGSAYCWNVAGPACSANPRGKKSYLSQQGTRCTSIDGPYLVPGLRSRNAREPPRSPVIPVRLSRADDRLWKSIIGSPVEEEFLRAIISHSHEREALSQTVLWRSEISFLGKMRDRKL